MKLLHKKAYLTIQDKQYLVNIYVENRYGSRVSITSKGIHIRLPEHFSNDKKNEEVKSCLEWAKKKIIAKLATVELRAPYADNQIFKYGDIDFKLRFIHVEKQNSITCKLNTANCEINIYFHQNTDTKIAQKNIGVVLSKLMGEYFCPSIEQRLRAFNDQYIQKKISKVEMKNTGSRWGSCSSKGIISISTRLLFAPAWVVDYVLIHELCHLVHMDHSNQFWALVKSILPNYEIAEKHLTDKGGAYNF